MLRLLSPSVGPCLAPLVRFRLGPLLSLAELYHAPVRTLERSELGTSGAQEVAISSQLSAVSLAMSAVSIRFTSVHLDASALWVSWPRRPRS